MSEKPLDDRTKKMLKGVFKYDEDQIKIIEDNSKQRDILAAGGTLSAKKLVVECVRAENCMAHKVGDKYVFTAYGQLIKNESCEKPCLWAMCNFIPFSYMVYDRIVSGLDPAGMHFDHVSCMDTGCRYGGWGTAMFKVTAVDA
jgi:uncharacterized repeat protein (TIGR04076 family)